MTSSIQSLINDESSPIRLASLASIFMGRLDDRKIVMNAKDIKSLESIFSIIKSMIDPQTNVYNSLTERLFKAHSDYLSHDAEITNDSKFSSFQQRLDDNFKRNLSDRVSTLLTHWTKGEKPFDIEDFKLFRLICLEIVLFNDSNADYSWRLQKKLFKTQFKHFPESLKINKVIKRYLLISKNCNDPKNSLSHLKNVQSAVEMHLSFLNQNFVSPNFPEIKYNDYMALELSKKALQKHLIHHISVAKND
ncbi:MAG: hypothetical protein JHC93_07425 [Parachlamydiales bacterium]|nr:hypothetical protein [Parachlamydiales bacterium]